MPENVLYPSLTRDLSQIRKRTQLSLRQYAEVYQNIEMLRDGNLLDAKNKPLNILRFELFGHKFECNNNNRVFSLIELHGKNRTPSSLAYLADLLKKELEDFQKYEKEIEELSLQVQSNSLEHIKVKEENDKLTREVSQLTETKNTLVDENRGLQSRIDELTELSKMKTYSRVPIALRYFLVITSVITFLSIYVLIKAPAGFSVFTQTLKQLF